MVLGFQIWLRFGEGHGLVKVSSASSVTGSSLADEESEVGRF